ncbi:MAG: ABC transporter ATP-binding protein/permease [Lachnospiraceae bacterium]|nr:ABC transporter ATP-binding protein/permease [Lachnospiraceae bacterium]
MMINKRLIALVPESRKYITANVVSQWVSLAANVVIMGEVAFLLGNAGAYFFDHKSEAADRAFDANVYFTAASICLIMLIIKAICTYLSSRFSYKSSKAVKKTLRQMIYDKILRLGASYTENASTAEVVQVSVEGVDQLETYFGSYLPQFFYATLAPLTLFIVLSFVDIWSALVLLICVPMIPMTIIVIQKWAKKLLSKYWGQYTALGDTFLENLQGLTTAKIYGADDYKHRELNTQSEHFRKITMKVLTMQLNSVTIMDFIAYGGAAVGMIVALVGYSSGRNTFTDTLFIMLLSADFFIPMRILGSFFHVAMNGMAATDKIFKLLDLEEEKSGREEFGRGDIEFSDVTFSYDGDRNVLNNISMKLKRGSFTAVVGESGSGKSTLAGLIMKRNSSYSGSITVGKTALADISEKSLYENVTYVGINAYLFGGTLRENLLMAKPDATDEELNRALHRVNILEFTNQNGGLDMKILERGENLSGGQCQRIAIARALLHDTDIYIFDEATSNIDVESESDILSLIHEMAKSKTVILITHRLANVINADRIYVLCEGKLVESGNHEELVNQNGTYASLYKTQSELENIRREDAHEEEK